MRRGEDGSRSEGLAAVDEANLVLDHAGQVNVFLVAGLLEAGGFVGQDAHIDMAALRAGLENRIAEIPALRRIPVPAGRRHRWVGCPPDLEQQVRLVDAVHGRAGLERLCGDLMTVPLRLDRPPWELLVVPGADGDQLGIVLRIHHAIADGAAAVELVTRLFEHGATSPAAAAVAQPAPPVPHGPPLRPSLGRIAFAIRRILTTVAGRGIGSTVLLGRRSPHRSVAFLDLDLTELASQVRARGATINDALLESACAGYAAAITAAAEPLPAELPVSIPVALARRGTANNQVGVMIVRLPVAMADPEARLLLIAERTAPEKVRAREQGTLEFMRGPRGAAIMDAVARRQHLVAGFMTNVPGPSEELRLAGAPITSLWPVAVLAGNVRLGVAALSYAGRLRCGIHFDSEAVPGAVFAHAMESELMRLAGTSPRPR